MAGRTLTEAEWLTVLTAAGLRGAGKDDVPDPLVGMFVHAVSLAGADRADRVARFFKEAGPTIRELHRASLLSDEEYWGDYYHQHLDNTARASAQATMQEKLV